MVRVSYGNLYYYQRNYTKINTMKIMSILKPIFLVLFMVGIWSNSIAQSTNSELSRVIKSGAFLVDVRTPQEYAAGSVKGAVNIPLDQIQYQIAKFKGKKSIVVFCRSGNRSSQAKLILENNKIKNVFNGGTWLNVNNVVKN